MSGRRQNLIDNEIVSGRKFRSCMQLGKNLIKAYQATVSQSET